MSIDPVHGPPGPRNPAAAGRASKATDADRPKSTGSDAVDISAEAQGQLDVHEMVVAARDAVKDLPDVREDKVRQARQRIEHQYYERPEVQGAIVDSLVRAFHPQPA